MSKFRVLVTDYPWPDLDLERRVLAEADAELIAPPDQDVKTLAAWAGDVDAVMTCWAPVPRPVLEAAVKCRMVSRLGIGLDNIDVAACTELGMWVTNVPDYCLVEVAEHTMALLLSLARKTAFHHWETKQGRYDLQSGPPLRRVSGQTLGIVGYGHIGREVARRASALGLQVIAAESRTGRPAFDDVRRLPLDDLLAASDYVSLHLPLTPATAGMIGRRELSLMKPSAYLINTARGGLVDHAALATALDSGLLSGAALDVQTPEPPDLSTPPWNHPLVLVTPHSAFYSLESVSDLRERASRQVVSLLLGLPVPHVRNSPPNPRVTLP